MGVNAGSSLDEGADARRGSMPLLQIDHDSLVMMALTFVLVLCIKLFYSAAGPDELRWILYPTAALVKAFTSLSFLFDPHKGYVAAGGAVVIGPGCAGLNFYVIALCMTTFSFIGRFNRHKLYWFFVFVLVTYAVTLCVNAFRIVGGIMLLDVGRSMHFAVSGALHSAQGTLFYFAFLIAYFIALRAILNQRNRNESIR
jgi:exosortase K